MTLKEAMEKVWNRPGVMYPRHRCWFNGRLEDGGYEIVKNVLYVKAGKPSGQVRPKKKGHSFLVKNYQFYWLNKTGF